MRFTLWKMRRIFVSLKESFIIIVDIVTFFLLRTQLSKSPAGGMVDYYVYHMVLIS